MSGTTQSSDTQSQSVNQIPQWVSNAGQQNYAFAQGVAAQPLTQYQGKMVADTSPQTQQAWDLAASSGNVGQDQYAGAQSGFLNSLGQTPGTVTAGQLSNTNLSPYMNPYTQNVIDKTLPIMQQNLGLSQVGNQNAASGANAFGGSRMGVQQGVTQTQGAQGMAQMAQQLNAANFGQAQSAAQQDIANRLTASQSNQSAKQAKINSDILASQGLANLGDSQTRANAANFTMLSQAGAGEQSQAQDKINANMAKFTQAANYPQQQLATLLSALGMTPHDTATTSSSQTQTTTPTNWGALAFGGLEDLSGFFKPGSDRRLKTDVTKIGKDPKTGLTMHAFRYKGDPKTYPKVVGPMAQEVEKKFPGATQNLGGRLTVDPSIMAASGVKGYARGTARVPGALATDSVPAMLTPGEAVLTQRAATQLGRNNITKLNTGTPPSSPLVAGALATMAPRSLASFMPPKRAFKAAVTMPRAGAKALGGLSNTKFRGALA